jgi:hypothetical protein
MLTAFPAAAGSVSVTGAQMRFIIPARPAAGYFKLDNGTDNALSLVGAASPSCGMLMLHQSREVNGTETMRPIKSVAVPAHGAVSFAPGGYHLMCMSPAAGMASEKTVRVTLKFADGSTVATDFAVHRAGGK